nr:MAG TPA: hypothetical protein [Caudoviricetes sp.]
MQTLARFFFCTHKRRNNARRAIGYRDRALNACYCDKMLLKCYFLK